MDKQQKTENVDKLHARPRSAIARWFLASRPQSFAAALAPALAGLGIAWRRLSETGGDFLIVPAVCCVGFALFAQVAANFINDYCDFRNGVDLDEPDGPTRALVEGWITPRGAFFAGFGALAVAILFGAATIPYGGAVIVAVGLASCLACVFYSFGGKPLAYVGLGDVAVVLFFGVVPTVFTNYLQTREISVNAALVGLALGLVCDNILVANNYRDRDHDRARGKMTSVALLGERFGRLLYLSNGIAAIVLLGSAFFTGGASTYGAIVTLVLYGALHFAAWRKLSRLRRGAALTRVYESSARNLLALAVMTTLVLL